MAIEKLFDDQPTFEASVPSPQQILQENWEAVDSKAHGWYKKCSQLGSPEEIQNSENSKWNRRELLKLAGESIMVMPEKREELKIDDIWPQVLHDTQNYRENGDMQNYLQMVYFINIIWPDRMLEIKFDEEIKEKVKREFGKDEYINWRIWPNILIIVKSLCPEILEKSDLNKKITNLEKDADGCYDHNWNNYLDVLVNLKTIAPEKVEQKLDEHGRAALAELLKSKTDQRKNNTEIIAKYNFVFEGIN